MHWDPTVNLGNVAAVITVLVSIFALYGSWARRMRKIETKINIMFMYFRKGLSDEDKEAIDKFFDDAN